MSYASKQPRQHTESNLQTSKAITENTFTDQRTSTAVQRQQQQMMLNASVPLQAGNTIQKRAWAATRPLGQKPGNDSKDDKDWDIGFGNLKLNHKHIIFDSDKNLPTGKEDNIGYHCASGGASGPGELFSEDHKNLGYTAKGDISNDPVEDQLLVKVIHQNSNFGDYNVITNNCQDWVAKVKSSFDALDKKNIEMDPI